MVWIRQLELREHVHEKPGRRDDGVHLPDGRQRGPPVAEMILGLAVAVVEDDAALP